MYEKGGRVGSKRVTDSDVISAVPCDLIQIILTQSSAPGACKVYNGVDTDGELKLDLKFAYSQSFEFPEGMHMPAGIYFFADTKVQCATIRWRVPPRVDGPTY